MTATARSEYLRAWRAARRALGRPVSRGTSRPLEFVAWDGEGETVRRAGGFQSGPAWVAAVDARARELLEARQIGEAPYWRALAEHGGKIVPEQFKGKPRGEYDDVPKRLLGRGAYPNADLIGRSAGTDAGDVLDFFRSHPCPPTLAAALEEARFELAGEYPAPADHRYTLLANSRDGVVARGDRLGSVTILEALLAGKARYPRAVHVFFGGSYDATMALKDCSRADVERLWRAGRFPERILGGRYGALYRPRRSLFVGRYRGRQLEAKAQLWDCWGFFQGSFVDALRKYGFDEQLTARIEAMKKRRPTFSAGDRAEVEAYCVQECELLEALMAQLAAALCGAGLRPRAWNGAGAVAAALLSREGVRRAIAAPPEQLEAPITRAFFGGRIELCQLGWAQGEVDVADVASAYPWAATGLPDLRGSWEPTREPAGFSLYRVRFRFAAALPWYPLPYRTPWGTILFPAAGEGWYWRPELEQALAFAAAHGGDVEVAEGWRLSCSSDGRPFAFLGPLYDKRATWKRECNGAEKAAKLGYNAVYGKLAQQLGGTAGRKPPYHCLAWAGWITAATRARLVEAALPDLGAVIAFMTDGIAARRPLRLPDYGAPNALGEYPLGAWERHAEADGAWAQAGVYWLRGAGGKWKAKYRGFDREGLERPDVALEAWARGVTEVSLPCTRFVGLGSALSSRELWDARGTWRTVARTLDLTGRSAKRMGVRLTDPAITPLPVQWNIHYDTTRELSAPYKLAWDAPLLDGAPAHLVEEEAAESFA